MGTQATNVSETLPMEESEVEACSVQAGEEAAEADKVDIFGGLAPNEDWLNTSSEGDRKAWGVATAGLILDFLPCTIKSEAYGRFTTSLLVWFVCI